MNPWDIAKMFVGMAFRQCAVGECTKYSLGMVCTRCKRSACLHHAYFSASVDVQGETLPKPKLEPLCAACVIESHPELMGD